LSADSVLLKLTVIIVDSVFKRVSVVEPDNIAWHVGESNVDVGVEDVRVMRSANKEGRVSVLRKVVDHFAHAQEHHDDSTDHRHCIKLVIKLKTY